jgi:propanediol dehydratase small subunit
VLLFVWGTHILPVYITSLQIEEQAHLPLLKPYRAKATVSLQVLESTNPFYQVEQVQRMIMSAANLLNLPMPF